MVTVLAAHNLSKFVVAAASALAKTGTVTEEIGKAVKEVKAGKIEFKVDKQGIIHVSVGKTSFDNKQLLENAKELLQAIVKLKPASTKGNYIKSVYLSSTMSPGINIEAKAVAEL